MATIPIDLKEGRLAQDDIIVGIDLGTTNSLVAYIEDGRPKVIRDAEGRSGLVPSIVHFLENGDPIIGDKARERLLAYPERTIYSVKRLMGKSHQDVDDWSDFFSYQIVDDEQSDSLVKIRIGDEYHNPIGLSAIILQELKGRAEKALSRSVSKAVITVPAYFNDVQRQATRDAGKLAGLDVLRIVNEPTAASLAYGLDRTADSKTIAVFDLGGGTFDVSILAMQEGIFEVLATHGDTFLGGDDFDRIIIEFWSEQLKLADTDDATWRQSIRLTAEEAKKALSKTSSFSGKVMGHPVAISLSEFEEMAGPLVERTITSCRLALEDAGIGVEAIDHVVMVGGSTRIPLVQSSVSDFFQQDVFNDLDPDEVVALGAAIQADVLAGNQKGILLLDVTPLSLGIETVGGLMDVIVPRNSKVPCKVGRQYTTSVDGQKNLKIAVYQGERDLVEDNRKLGEFILRDIPPMPMGIPKIEIKFLLDADGILRVNASELRSNTEQQLEINSAYSLSEEEMSLMLIDSLNNAQADIAEKAVREAINEADHLIKSTSRFIQQNEQLLKKDSLNTLTALNEQVQLSIETRDKNKIQKAMDALNDFATPLAHEAMDLNVANAMKDTSI